MWTVIYINIFAYTTSQGWIALGIITVGTVGYEVYKHWWSFPESDIDDIPFCVGEKGDAGPNDPHGDGGRTEIKAKKRIKELEEELSRATGREAKKIKQKIKNLIRDAQKKRKGETHSKRKKGY